MKTTKKHTNVVSITTKNTVHEHDRNLADWIPQCMSTYHLQLEHVSFRHGLRDDVVCKKGSLYSHKYCLVKKREEKEGRARTILYPLCTRWRVVDWSYLLTCRDRVAAAASGSRVGSNGSEVGDSTSRGGWSWILFNLGKCSCRTRRYGKKLSMVITVVILRSQCLKM